MYSIRPSTDPLGEDPLAKVLAPPPGETADQRAARLREEAEAKRVNDEIDERIKQERAAWKKQKNMFKLLLLGQSESGKSTMLKNFQLAFAPKAWKAERESWRAVIQLNLVRSINNILDILSQEMGKTPNATSPITSPFMRPVTGSSSGHGHANANDSGSPTAESPSSPPIQFSHTHALLKLRLAPLRRVEADLKQLIGAASDEITASNTTSALSGQDSGSSGDELSAAAPFENGTGRRRPSEYYVRSNASWREAVRSAYNRISGNDNNDMREGGAADGERLEDATDVIASCAEDMHALWKDEVVQELLKRRRIRMELAPGFFLNDIIRIAARDYEPTDDDIVRARLRTVGVQEYRLAMENYERPVGATASDVSRDWMIYDVGGSRTSRAAWYPYFDDANAILFLAPISCFDELLAEDRRVNRLEDSFLLWKGIIQSKLLAKCIIVLFLNKYDLLEVKLANGVKVNRYLPSFGERENTAPVLARYLFQKFRDQHREYSPQAGRPFYGYVTTAVDTEATASTLASVRDGVLRHNLHRADFV
ncbi:G-alpha-domain-containing protein [Lentinus tigrinus ALCF2SS1-7]|uniref:G-alpha-domain-containing protein n=1 Tax=Lentinus tigrinus ALCF2SS1-6 TaxID=1328759 RepID=A0A5C2RTC9_9APHY|nr:G-alpha-domain-containing protein [Lentinus tigrinus ALCF2SS1-6]RPD72661.1 G-alpha-domain-containing protein [Lentinus tigrinus ALCF2SS1-7]